MAKNLKACPTRIMDSLEKEGLKGLQKALQDGVKPDSQALDRLWRTEIMCAMTCGGLDAVRLLFQHGATANADAKDALKRTELQVILCESKGEGLQDYFLYGGQCVEGHFDAYGRTELMVAMHYCGAKGLKVLFEQGAKPNANARDVWGRTELQYVMRHGGLEGMISYLDKGGKHSPDAETGDGLTARVYGGIKEYYKAGYCRTELMDAATHIGKDGIELLIDRCQAKLSLTNAMEAPHIVTTLSSRGCSSDEVENVLGKLKRVHIRPSLGQQAQVYRV